MPKRIFQVKKKRENAKWHHENIWKHQSNSLVKAYSQIRNTLSIEWHHQDDDRGCSWHCSPLDEEKLTTIQEQDTTWRILEYRGEAEAYFCTKETKTDWFGRVREMATQWLNWPSPKPFNITWRCLPWSSDSPSRKRELKVGDNQPSSQHWRSLGGSPYSDLTLQGSLQGLNTENLTVIYKEERACNNPHTDLGRLSPSLQCPSNNSNQQLCSSAQPSQWHILTREHIGV